MKFRLALIFVTIILCNSACAPTNEPVQNRLAQSTSPYLQEHADNPVDWYEWGTEALTRAKNENKPLIISVGYASCHWCHVMEEESFMDTAVARMMNENFVSIKVDREERPDIDQIYINAAQLISGNAGWPLNAFAVPDGKPFYAATYFPKEQWMNVMKQILDAYKNDYANVAKQADAITKGIQTSELISVAENNQATINKKMYADIFADWETQLDFVNGGLSGSPKFPMPVVWEFLLQNNYLTGNKKSLEAVTTTLDAIAKGGIYDQLGGGFARYSTDSLWKAPHFEKMLYDNAQLVSLYAHAYQVTANPVYSKVIQETLDFVKSEFTSPQGGFYSSINADSEGVEGKFYVWTKTEIEKLLDKSSAILFFDYYNISDSGNWEVGKNILFKKNTDEDFASKHSITTQELDAEISGIEDKLLKERNKRMHPTTDDKILTSWNALMLTGYVDAYLALGKEEYFEAALTNAKFIEKSMMEDGGHLWRSFKDGEVSIDAFLDDHALLAKAFIKLYQATFDIHWLEVSRTLADYAILHFHDPKTGLFYYTSDEAEPLVVRKMEGSDNVIPSSNSVMADVLFRLGEYFDNENYRSLSKAMVNQMTESITVGGPYYANWASVLGMIAHQPHEVAVVGDDALIKCKILQQHYLPTAIFMGGDKENLPLLENKLVKGKTIIYVCRDKVCKLPVEDVEEALDQLKGKL